MEVLQEFEQKFEEVKKDIGFNSTLEELDSSFFLRDYIQKEKIIYYNLDRVICARINDTFNSWLVYIHSLIIPNPKSMINLTESQSFTNEEKKKFNEIIVKVMALTNRSKLIDLTKDKREEANFIDGGLKLWKELNPEFKRITEKVISNWEDKKKELSQSINYVFCYFFYCLITIYFYCFYLK